MLREYLITTSMLAPFLIGSDVTHDWTTNVTSDDDSPMNSTSSSPSTHDVVPSSEPVCPVVTLDLTSAQSDVIMFGYTVVIPVICTFGVVGNLINLSVLLQAPIRNKTPYIYLTALAVADMLTLVLEMINGIGQFTCTACYGWKIFDSYVHLPVGGMTSCMSVGTVSVYTAERYVYIKAPFLARRYCKAPVARRAVCGVIVFSILFNLPYFFAFRVDSTTDQMCYTPFATTIFYEVLNWIRLVALGLLPAILLTFVNVALLITLHRAHRRALMRPRHYLHEEYRLHQRCRVTTCLISIIVLFIVGELPTDLTSRTSALYLLYGGDSERLYSWQYELIRLISTTFMCLHYAFNFLVYCTLDTRFVQIFKRTFCRLCAAGDSVVHTIAI